MSDTEKKSAFEALRVHYHTFRSRQLRTEGHRKIYGNRSGVKTDLGDLEMEEWLQMARKLIQDSGEQQLQADLQQWVRERVPWLHNETEREQYALKLHMDRIFDNREWVDYIPFNQRYRPEVLKAAKLVWIRTNCCQKPGMVTKELLCWAEKGMGADATIHCPICGRWSGYRRCSREEIRAAKNDSTTIMEGE